jgi:hypothetical protein
MAGAAGAAGAAGVASVEVCRVVVISAAGVGDSLLCTNAAMRWMLSHSTLGEMYRDLGQMEELLRASTLDWVAVRPVTLVDGAPSARTRVLTRYRTASIVSRGDVAAWLLRAATEAPVPERTPMIGWW